MLVFYIDSNIPVAEKWLWKYHRNRKKNIAWPFKSMEVGDSFLLRDNLSIRAASASKVWGVKHGRTFTCRRVTEHDYRLWRTA